MAFSITCGFLFFTGLATGSVWFPSYYGLDVEIDRGSGKGCLFKFVMTILILASAISGYYSYQILF